MHYSSCAYIHALSPHLIKVWVVHFEIVIFSRIQNVTEMQKNMLCNFRVFEQCLFIHVFVVKDTLVGLKDQVEETKLSGMS